MPNLPPGLALSRASVFVTKTVQRRGFGVWDALERLYVRIFSYGHFWYVKFRATASLALKSLVQDFTTVYSAAQLMMQL